MAFDTGSATDLDDLFSTISTFVQSHGWTEDELNTTTGCFALHKNSVYVSFRWDAAGTVNNVSMHQALGYTGGNEPGDHPDDSGNGYNATTAHTDALLDNERCIRDLGDGPYPSYFIFENDSGPAYVHVVVEISTDVFRHFGFGELDKFGDWDTASGGEYVYGHYKELSTATATTDTCLLDGLFSDTTGDDDRRAATVHMEDWPNQAGTSKWGQIWGNRTSADPDATDATAKVKVQGGFRSGPVARHFGWLSAGSTSGLIPMYPVGIFYDDEPNDFAYFMGWQADVRGINIRFFAPKDTVVIGSDTWYIFPTTQRTLDNVTERSYYQGIAYKRVDA